MQTKKFHKNSPLGKKTLKIIVEDHRYKHIFIDDFVGPEREIVDLSPDLPGWAIEIHPGGLNLTMIKFAECPQDYFDDESKKTLWEVFPAIYVL